MQNNIIKAYKKWKPIETSTVKISKSEKYEISRDLNVNYCKNIEKDKISAKAKFIITEIPTRKY